MANRPILRLPDPSQSTRRLGKKASFPRPHGPGREAQGQRFQNTFERIASALDAENPEVVLREDPSGIAPERALVFVTAGSIQNFVNAARSIGLVVFAEFELESFDDYPEGFEISRGAMPRRMFYATMPTLEVFQRLLSFWRMHQSGKSAPSRAAPWWSLFDLLLELRPWGPEDRLTESAREVIEDRLAFNEGDDVFIEFEIFPDNRSDKRTGWRLEVESRIAKSGGQVIDRSSITETGFIYEAVLASLPAQAIRQMLDDPWDSEGLATVHGVQFILPQTIGQAAPSDTEGKTDSHEPGDHFDSDAPIRAALLDGTPVAGHEALDGGVVIEDLHDLVRLSTVSQRHHATGMASLILRGDLKGDGKSLQDTRLICIPLLVDNDEGAWSPENRLLVDVVHSTLMRLMGDKDPVAPDVFVVNFSIGIKDTRFAGQMSALARLIDWWSEKEGVLFVISAGNIANDVDLTDITAMTFSDSSVHEQRQTVRAAIRTSIYERTLLAPAEAINAITVGAVSKDLNSDIHPEHTGIISLEDVTDSTPQITSALGLGLHRGIKPDLLHVGGRIEVRALPNGQSTRLRPVQSQRTGLVVASPLGGPRATLKSRGTSSAAALTTRAILQAAQALTAEGGPYEGQELPRRMIALLSRALAVNATRWPEDALSFYEEEIKRLGKSQHARAKEEVCRYFGHGLITPELMQYSPDGGATMVGFGSIRKDQALIFKMPLPPSMAGERVPRSMRATIAWFSPVNPSRAQYRLASLEAVIANDINDDEDESWRLDLKSDGPNKNMVKRGSVWSRRLVNRVQRVPSFAEDAEIPICVQCRDCSGGGLNPDDDIAFALAITLEIEANVEYDIYDEVKERIQLRLKRREQ